MKLSKYFTLDEFTHSQTAVRKNIDNTPSVQDIENLKGLCTNLLDPIDLQINHSIIISSGYRSVALNKEIGGAPTSQHTKGEAADIIASGITVEVLYQLIKQSGLKFDQLIQEFDKWVHISFKMHGGERGQCLRAIKNNEGNTIYKID